MQYNSKLEAKGKLNKAKPIWITSSSSGKERIIYGKFVVELVAKHNRIIFLDGTFYIYNGKIWQKVNKEEIKIKIQQEINNYDCTLCSKNAVKEIYVQLINYTFRPKREIKLNDNRNIIIFANGVLNIKSSVFDKHKPEYYQTFMLPYEYNPKKTCPNWIKFLNELQFSDPNTILRLQEWFGYCLTKETKMQKCLYLKGESNIKAICLEMLISIVGKENIMNVEIKDLFKSFRLYDLFDKSINICSNLKNKKVLSQKFKRVVSGDDISVNIRHKDNKEFRPFTKHIFSSNNYLPKKDKLYDFFEMFDIINFEKTFSKLEQEILVGKLKKEIQGISNWALKGLYRLIENKW